MIQMSICNEHNILSAEQLIIELTDKIDTLTLTLNKIISLL
jgi:hypothetical protein